jgi:hypothetical protein
MSSHHFVKEQQEPALLILNADAIEFAVVGPMLEWVPTIVVAQEALERVISWGIKVDVVLADPDFQQIHIELLESHHPLRFYPVLNGNFAQEGLKYLKEKGHHAVNLIGFPHMKIFQLEEFLNLLDLVIIDEGVRFIPVKNGRLKKWYPATALQLHAPEDSWIEIQHQEGSELVQVKYATVIEIPEGLTVFNSKSVFWIGEFINPET